MLALGILSQNNPNLSKESSSNVVFKKNLTRFIRNKWNSRRYERNVNNLILQLVLMIKMSVAEVMKVLDFWSEARSSSKHGL